MSLVWRTSVTDLSPGKFVVGSSVFHFCLPNFDILFQCNAALMEQMAIPEKFWLTTIQTKTGINDPINNDTFGCALIKFHVSYFTNDLTLFLCPHQSVNYPV